MVGLHLPDKREPIYSSEAVRPGFEELLREYVAELPPSIRQLEGHLQASNQPGCEHGLHRLAGSLGMYGYRGLEGHCRALLGRIRSGELVAEMQPEFKALIGQLHQVRARPERANSG
jgi:HPt (histidine-containing phosphotransfer) domain-containing protein